MQKIPRISFVKKHLSLNKHLSEGISPKLVVETTSFSTLGSFYTIYFSIFSSFTVFNHWISMKYFFLFISLALQSGKHSAGNIRGKKKKKRKRISFVSDMTRSPIKGLKHFMFSHIQCGPKV